MKFEKFQEPDSILRPAPFWAINDRLTPEETARQMSEMIDVGLSGGFFHSRAGLTTEYMGDDWFASIEAALKVAKEKDGYLWLYDEDLWPSGNAGGQVAGKKDEYRSATLVPEFVPAGREAGPDGEDEPKAAAGEEETTSEGEPESDAPALIESRAGGDRTCGVTFEALNS